MTGTQGWRTLCFLLPLPMSSLPISLNMSAICFSLMPHELDTFWAHRLWTFILHAGRERLRLETRIHLLHWTRRGPVGKYWHLYINQIPTDSWLVVKVWEIGIVQLSSKITILELAPGNNNTLLNPYWVVLLYYDATTKTGEIGNFQLLVTYVASSKFAVKLNQTGRLWRNQPHL